MATTENEETFSDPFEALLWHYEDFAVLGQFWAKMITLGL